ncbi:restriction endonuclease subunit S [Chromohalobacter moromii]|uniref:Restriction endonuclease subunit S n=1 Tax=Chromohalobacter moromii TaxID=2860329 RepID=A0A9X2X4K3_9GAMM|nr:restriction endonuclease subunit S [Chromohalobacter moromii]MCK2047064.1 restriction endonuclease subunit S [Chromohalobacter moromii]MCT8506641.1 restriction endonuclease subunit S [Chromohalobacter moromii]
MSHSWPKHCLKDLCYISSSRRIRAHEYQDSGVPFYRGKEIIERHNGALRVSTDLFITEERYAEVCAKNGAPSPGDLLLTSVGTLGVPYVVKPGERFYFKDGNLTWFRGFDGLIVEYLYYWLLSPAGKAELKRCTIGSSQPAFTIVLLKEIEINLPSIERQGRIASILSAYDDLIENNTRRIEILEEMARRLYEEWFVHFRFPGHEEASFKESELGVIPEGWECATLKEYIELVYGKALKKSERKPGVYPVYGSSGEVGTHSEPLVKGPGIILGRKGNVGNVFWTEKDFFPIDTVYYIKTDLPLEYVFFSLQRQRFLNNDAAVPGLNRNQAYSLPFLRPSQKVLEEFTHHCKPIYELVRKLHRKNTNLHAQRDLLLPKLVSGEIDVSDIPMPDDKEVKAA